MSRRYRESLAECGWCVITEPDSFGMSDFIEHPDCPEHGIARELEPERRIEEDDRDEAA